jgi:molybdopterin-guanine dinucleotide biosynthesis protein A
LALNAAADSAAAADAARRGGTVVADPPGLPAGPLAGILAGLLWAEETGAGLLLTLPCDTPLVPGDLAQRLIAAAAERPCAVARTPDGIHSLCAAWRTELIAPLRARLEAGEHPPVHAFLQAHGCGFVDYPDATGFLNVNTPQDLAEAERRLPAAS